MGEGPDLVTVQLGEEQSLDPRGVAGSTERKARQPLVRGRARHRVDATPRSHCNSAVHPRWPVEQTAPVAERWPVGDGAALTPPGEVSPA
jgi:hypothetical protein